MLKYLKINYEFKKTRQCIGYNDNHMEYKQML
jgi:hypothetical protein